MNTLEKIQDIFYSGSYAFSGDLYAAQKIAFLIDEGYLTLTTFCMATTQEYLQLGQEIGQKLICMMSPQVAGIPISH